MSTDGTPNPANPTPAASGGANTGAATSSPTPAPTPTRAADGRFEPRDWRYPADYHVAELRGRTAEEAASYFKTFYTQALSAQPPKPAAAPPPAPPALPDDTEWLSAPTQAFQKAAQGLVASQLQPTMQTLFQQNASTNRALVAQRFPEVFDKWAPEIDALALQLDPQYRTYENMERIVKMVKAEHNDEIVAAKLESAVQARLQSMGGGLRADGSVAGSGAPAPSGIDLDSKELPEEYRQVLASVNMKPRDLPDFLRKYYGPDVDLDKAMKDWFDKAKSGRVITESRAGWRMERR